MLFERQSMFNNSAQLIIIMLEYELSFISVIGNELAIEQITGTRSSICHYFSTYDNVQENTAV